MMANPVPRISVPSLPPSKVAVFTIASNNYSAHARVLMDSLATYEPGWDRWVLVVDTPPATPLIEPPRARVKLATELPLPAAGTFFIRYDILEANTAVKPWMIEWLFQQGYEWVVYLDPDIQVFAPLLELTEAFAHSSVVLTPHITQPFNDDKRPDELLIKRTGIFNLGFGSFRNDDEGRRMVKWWQGHLAENCVNALGRGIFVDQSWMNFCPVYCSRLHVLKHPGYNAAYWNLHYRTPSGVVAKGQIRVDERNLLRFFHFSGFDYRHPRRLSKHQDRFKDEDLSADVRALLQQYADALIAAEIETISKIPYRLAPRELPSHQVGKAFENPCFKPVFHPENKPPGQEEWRDYLLSADPRRPSLPVFLANIWFRRPDLSAAFPLDHAGSLEAFCRWFEHSGRKDEGLPADFPTWGWWSGGESRSPVVIDDKPLVTVYGYFEAVSGVGESARGSVRAMQRLEHPHRVVNFSVGNQSKKIRPALQFGLPGASGAIDLIHVNCDQAEVFLNARPEVSLPGRYRIAYWAWEQEILPPRFLEHASHFDEIWCPSEANAAVFKTATKQPVRVVPHNLDLSVLAAPASLAGILPLPAGVRYFLAFADFHSFPERKGPLNAVEAYREAFPQAVGGIALVVKIANASYRPTYWEKLQAAAAGRADIVFLAANLSRAQVNRLVADALGFVSLHTQEGFGLPIAEAIALGVPAICTNYGGNTDFCTVENSRLVPYELVTLEEDIGPYRAGTRWAKPNLHAAASHLRELAAAPRRPGVGRASTDDPISRRSYELYGAALGAATRILVERTALAAQPKPTAFTLPLHHQALDEFSYHDGILHLAGWAQIDVASMSMVKASAVVRGGHKEFIFSLTKIRRVDVAAHFKNATQMEAGFHGIVPLGHLAPGEYQVDIIFEGPTGRALWNTQRSFKV